LELLFQRECNSVKYDSDKAAFIVAFFCCAQVVGQVYLSVDNQYERADEVKVSSVSLVGWMKVMLKACRCRR
jgi:hypothetical protein